MKHNNTDYDSRYKYKLNMLEPGLIIMKMIGVLFVIGIVTWIAKWHWLSTIFWSLAGVIFAVLLILVAIEAHQDKVLNDIAISDRDSDNRCRDKSHSMPLSSEKQGCNKRS